MNLNDIKNETGHLSLSCDGSQIWYSAIFYHMDMENQGSISPTLYAHKMQISCNYILLFYYK